MKFFESKSGKSEIESEEQRVVALLDVDQTLIKERGELNKKGETKINFKLNEGLLESLKKQGIKDIYLFTNMGLNDISDFIENESATRQHLIQDLESRGFTVHGAITPADVGYDKGLSAAFYDLYGGQYNRMLDGELTKNNVNNNDHPEMNDKEFKEVSLKFNEYAHDAVDEKDPHNTKGKMYQYFLKHLPKWVHSVIVCDDDAGNLTYVKEANKKFTEENPKNKIPYLTTIQIDKKREEWGPDDPDPLVDQLLREHSKEYLTYKIANLRLKLQEKQGNEPTSTQIRDKKIEFLNRLINHISTSKDEKELALNLNNLEHDPFLKGALSGLKTHKVRDVFEKTKKYLLPEKESAFKNLFSRRKSPTP